MINRYVEYGDLLSYYDGVIRVNGKAVAALDFANKESEKYFKKY